MLMWNNGRSWGPSPRQNTIGIRNAKRDEHTLTAYLLPNGQPWKLIEVTLYRASVFIYLWIRECAFAYAIMKKKTMNLTGEWACGREEEWKCCDLRRSRTHLPHTSRNVISQQLKIDHDFKNVKKMWFSSDMGTVLFFFKNIGQILKLY